MSDMSSTTFENPFLSPSSTATESSYQAATSIVTNTDCSKASKLFLLRSLFVRHHGYPLSPNPKTSPEPGFTCRRPKTPHTIDEPPWAPFDLESRIDATLVESWKSSWWRLYADTVRLRQHGNNSSRAVYLAVHCWATAAGVNDRAERVALFRCYHDDAAMQRLGYARYGETMWRLCEEDEEREYSDDESETGRMLSRRGIRASRTW